MLCFQGGSLLADFASLMQESKERCIYSKLYAVCYVFRAVLLADFASLIQESKERCIIALNTLSCMLCVMFSGRFVVG